MRFYVSKDSRSGGLRYVFANGVFSLHGVEKVQTRDVGSCDTCAAKVKAMAVLWCCCRVWGSGRYGMMSANCAYYPNVFVFVCFSLGLRIEEL